MELIGVQPRRAGTALLAFGSAGAVLTVICAIVLLVATVMTASLGGSLEQSRTDLVASLQRAEVSIGHAADTTEHVASTLGSTQTVLTDSAATLGSLADATGALATSLAAISILGNQPFAAAAASFRALSDQLRSYAGHAQQLAADLATNATDLTTITADLRDLQTRLGQTADRLAGLDVGGLVTALAAGLGLLVLTALWLTAGALGLAWAGHRIRRGTTPAAVARA